MWSSTLALSGNIGSDINLVGCCGFYDFGQVEATTGVIGRIAGINYLTGFIDNPAGQQFEKCNTRQPNAGDYNAGAVFGMQNMLGTTHNMIKTSTRSCSYCAWRGDWRRSFWDYQDGGIVHGNTGLASTIVVDNSPMLGNKPIYRRLNRKHRRFGWTYSEQNCHFHKKTGAGSFELTSRPHAINDGFTFLDKRCWENGMTQAEVYNANLNRPLLSITAETGFFT